MIKSDNSHISGTLSRRAMLRVLMGAGVLAGTGPILSTATRAADPQNVVVIGAGAAGLAAAQQLAAAGHRVQVIEGRDRIGGRILTSRQWQGLPVDLGASWIHGAEDNPLTAIADTAGIERFQMDYDRLLVHATDGSILDQGARQDTARLAKDIKRRLGGMRAGRCLVGAETSLERFLTLQMKPDRMTADRRNRFWYLMAAAKEHDYAADASEMSLCRHDDDERFDGPDMLFPGGYDQIAEALAENLTIRTGVTVRAIRLTGGGVALETTGGRIAADRVICTLPVGVLKDGGVRFEPGLPDDKLSALSGIGAGVMNKCVLRFNQVFWDPNSHMLGYVPAARGQWVEWLNLHGTLGQPALMGFNVGRYAAELEQLSDRDVADQALTVLRKIHGNRVPEPTGVQVTRWSRDPFAMGAFSFAATGMEKDARDTLAAPVENRIFFAGEATSIDYPGTVHGAILSGRRAAEDVSDS